MKNINKHDKVVARFRDAYSKTTKSKECIEEIRNRNFLERIFSNNTCDLAETGIAQNELLCELNCAIRDVLELIQSQGCNIGDIWSVLEFEKTNSLEVLKDIADKFRTLFKAAVDQKKQIDGLSTGIKNGHDIYSVREQISKFKLDAKDIDDKLEIEASDKLCMLCEALQKYFSNTPVSNNSKREILDIIRQGHFPEINTSDLCAARPKLKNIFRERISHQNNNGAPFFQLLATDAKINNERLFSMEKVISGILDEVIAQEGDRYVEFRNELVKLLDDFGAQKIDIDENDEYAKLSKIKKRLLESQFEIALVGEFQGGKSTTFNMLCGGREISPRGLNGGGIKTSAVIVTAQNINDDEDKNGLKEWAEISWLSLVEIQNRICDVLNIYNENSNIINYREIPSTKVDKLIDCAWKQNLESEDLLRIATLQYNILKKDVFKSFSSTEIVPIDKFQHIVKFPLDWENRWLKKQNAEFSKDECMFAFIDCVLVRIHSSALERLGCRITDCPGLFVSQWDTERAMRVMERANAIWYLLDGDRQIGGNDQGILKKIKDVKWDEKCFFSINMKKNVESSNYILDTDRSSLKNQGFYQDRVYLYDAYLAFRAAQASLINESELSPNDIECLAEETKRKRDLKEVRQELAEKSNAVNAVFKLINSHLAKLEYAEFQEQFAEEGLSLEMIKKLRAESRVEEITTSIEKMIISKKARSILVAEGVDKCLNVLNLLDAKLQRRQKAVNQTRTEAEDREKKAREHFNEFIKSYEERFEFLNIQDLDLGLAHDFFDEYNGDIRTEIKERGKKICYKEWKSGGHLDSADVNQKTERKIKEEFVELIKAKLTVYSENITSRDKFKSEILDKLNMRINEMINDWGCLQDKHDLFKGIKSLVNEEENFNFGTFDQTLESSIDTPYYSWEFLKDFITLGIRRVFQTPKDRIDDFFNKEDPIGNAYDIFKGDAENIKQIAAFLGKLRCQLRDNIKQTFAEMREKLEKNITDAKKTVELANTDKEEVAKQAKKSREEVIEPYIAKIEKYKHRVCLFYTE